MISRACFLPIVFPWILAAGCADTTKPVRGPCERVRRPVAFNVAGAPTVEFSVPDMMCPESCAVKVKEILSEQPGAKEVVVDFDSKTATVAIEEGQVRRPSGDRGSGRSWLRPLDAEVSRPRGAALRSAKRQPAG